MVNPNVGTPNVPRSNAVNAVNVPNTAAPLYRPPTSSGVQQPLYRPPVAGTGAPQLPPRTQPFARPVNPQFRPVQQNAQLGPKLRGPPPNAKCAGRGCRR